MRCLGRLAWVTLAMLSGLGCAPAGELDSSQAGGGDPAGEGGAGSGGDPGSGAGSPIGGGPSVEGSIGVVVIDVQETFVDGAANADMAAIIDRTRAAFQLATDHDVPFFITFEASQSGDHALHAPLQPHLPAHAQDFIKTTFGATGLPAFASALQQSGLSHLVVVGAETDVCVLQTVLGLRQLGFTVMLQQDAVFTEETNTSPALRRMQQAGTLLVSEADVAGYVADPADLPADGGQAVTMVLPMQMGVVLHGFDEAALAAENDTLRSQKAARLRELLLVSEWFELPVYVADVGAGLPAEFEDYYLGSLRPVSQIASDTAVTQLVFAGTDGGLADAMSSWLDGRDLFVMEDALLTIGTAAEQSAMLQPLFDQGLVPITYKSFYYDMTKSVDLAEWPSQEWVARFEEYYDITQAPEDLPSMPGS